MERKTAVPVNTGTQVQIDPNKIPGYAAHNIAQVLHKSIWEAWNDPAIRAEYEQWKREQQEEGGKKFENGRVPP